MVGRPSKLTSQVIAALAEGIAAGLPYELVCRQAGISERTFNNWSVGSFPKSTPEELQRLFLRTIKSAEAEALYEALAVINAAAQGTAPPGADWRAAAWFLERRYPQDYGRRRSVHLSATEG